MMRKSLKKKMYRLTSVAPLFLGNNLPAGQGAIVYLHTCYSSLKISLITTNSSHSHRIVCRQPYSPNASRGHKSRVDKQFCYTSSVIVRCSYELPSSWYHGSTCDRCRQVESPSTCKSHKQRPRCNHPEVNSPAIRFVVEDRTSSAFMVDWSQKGNGLLSVQATSIGEVNETPP